VSALSCDVSNLLIKFVQVYELVLLVYAVVSWIPDLRGPWVRYLAVLVDPILTPLRRVIPPLGGFDLSFLVLLLALQIVAIPLLDRLAANVCYGI
jgi:YggT family protein